MDINQFHKNLLNDTRIELMEEFDRNFERKAFFDKAWPKNKLVNRKGSMMARSNNLRRGYKAKIEGEKIAFSNSMPYASIHNEGGEIKVTAKMKKYFWAMFYQSTGSIKKNKGGKATKSQSNRALSVEAQQWKAMALMPIGKRMKIPSRRVIGQHPKVNRVIENVIDNNLKDLNEILKNKLKQ